MANHFHQSQTEYSPLIGPENGDAASNGHGGHGVIAEGRQRNTSTVRTIFNIIKTYIGIGVLGLPHAWSEAGVIAAVASMAILAIISLHCLRLLVQAKEDLVARGDNVFTFGDVTVVAFGRFGRAAGIVVDFLLCFTQLGACASYVNFLGKNTKSLFTNDLPWQVFAAIWLVVLILLAWIRTLKWLAPFAQVAMGILIAGLVTILTAAMMSLSQNIKEKKPIEVKLVDWIHIPTMLSVAIFAFEGVGFVIPAQTAIKDPKRYPFVLTLCIVVVSVLYSIFATLCYIGFGDKVSGDLLQTVLDWSDGSKTWTIIIKIIAVGLLLAIACTYPIQLFPVTDLIEERIFEPRDVSWFEVALRNNFRAVLVFITAVVAMTIEQLDVIMGLIGSLGAGPLQFIFPPVIWLLIHRHDAQWYMKALCIFYVIFGILCTVLGTSLNIMKLVTGTGGGGH